MNTEAKLIKTKVGVLKELSPNFPDWTSKFAEFIQWEHFGLLSPDTDEYVIWKNIEDLYQTLLLSMIRMSGIKDQWEGPGFLPMAVKAGMQVYYRSLKLECPFHFGTDELGFIINSPLIYSENLRKMDDPFWFNVAELTRLGNTELWENRIFPESHLRTEPWFHRKTKSTIFELIAKAIAWEREEGSSEGLGMFVVRLGYDTPWDELLEKGTTIFHNLYTINKALRKKHR